MDLIKGEEADNTQKLRPLSDIKEEEVKMTDRIIHICDITMMKTEENKLLKVIHLLNNIISRLTNWHYYTLTKEKGV